MALERTQVKPSSGDREVIDGKWAIEKKLGQGGMGTVYLAHDIDLGRSVAIKMLSESLAENPELIARFEREARMMARLDHPNLVPIYAVGRRGKTPFIVMKHLQGHTVAERLEGGTRLEGAELLSLVKQLCEGLQFIHEHRVVHRDVKPANIFVSRSGHVTLLDLGVARDTDNAMTRTGMLMGTVRYMAPEQILGKHVDFAADIYALATVAYEAVTGRAVFEAPTDYELMRAHVDRDPPDASMVVALPGGVGAVLQRGLAKDPAQRFACARDFGAAFEAAWNSGAPPRKPVATLPPVAPPSLATPMPARAELSPDERALAASVSRSRAPMVAVAALVVLVAFGAVAWWSTGGPGETPTKADAPQKVEPPAREELQAKAAKAELSTKAVPPPGPILSPKNEPTAKAETPAKAEPVAKAERPVKVDPSPRATSRTGDVTVVVKVNGGPAPAYVDIDGERQSGATPFVTALAAGKHTLVFRREGARSVTREITVTGAQPQKVLVEMEK